MAPKSSPPNTRSGTAARRAASRRFKSPTPVRRSARNREPTASPLAAPSSARRKTRLSSIEEPRSSYRVAPNEVPRRGARAPEKAVSVFSIASDAPFNEDGEDNEMVDSVMEEAEDYEAAGESENELENEVERADQALLEIIEVEHESDGGDVNDQVEVAQTPSNRGRRSSQSRNTRSGGAARTHDMPSSKSTSRRSNLVVSPKIVHSAKRTVPSSARPDDAGPSNDVSSAREEPLALDLKVVKLLRGDLISASTNLITHLAQEQSENETWVTIRTAYLSTFHALRPLYQTDTKSMYISLTGFLESLHLEQGSAEADHFLPALSAANLAILTDILYDVEFKGGSNLVDVKKLMLEVLRDIDEGFPWRFVSPSSLPLQWLEDHDPLDLALQVRTLRWTLTVLTYDIQDPRIACRIGREIFSHDHEGKPSNSIQFKRLGDVDFEEEFENSEVRNKVQARFTAVCRLFWQTGGIVEDKIMMAFPIDLCIERLRGWIMEAFEQVKATIDQSNQRGAGQSPKPTSRPEEDTSEHTASPEIVRAEGQPSKSLFQGTTSMLSFKRLASSQQDASTVPSTHENPRPPTPEPNTGVAATETGSIELAVMDEDDDDFEPLRSPRDRHLPVRTENPRRLQDTDESWEPEQESTRQGSTRDRERSRQVAPTQAVRASQPVRPSQPVRASQPVPASPAASPRPEEDEELVMRVPQRRTPWSEQDSDELIYWIGRLGCGWSEIAKKATFSTRRTQQHIRDRARNIKVDVLRNDRVLPFGFDFVLLSTKEIETLRKCNKNPYRSEADVNSRGEPTSTVWID